MRFTLHSIRMAEMPISAENLPYLVQTSETLIDLIAIRLMLNRLTKS